MQVLNRVESHKVEFEVRGSYTYMSHDWNIPLSSHTYAHTSIILCSLTKLNVVNGKHSYIMPAHGNPFSRWGTAHA